MDERPLKLLARTPVDEEHKQRLFALARQAHDLADADRRELLWEFGREHVGAIAEHNQFLRLFRGGEQPGCIELWLTPEGRAAAEAAGIETRDPDGAVFKMFGWRRIDPAAADADALDAALRDAYGRACQAPVRK